MTIFWPFYKGNVFKLYLKNLNWTFLLHFGIRKSISHSFRSTKLKNPEFLDFLACNWALFFRNYFFEKYFWVSATVPPSTSGVSLILELGLPVGGSGSLWIVLRDHRIQARIYLDLLGSTAWLFCRYVFAVFFWNHFFWL